jgi:hypothetical protein
MEYLHPAGGVVGGRHSPRAKPRDERRSPADRVFDSAKPVNQQFEAEMVAQGRIHRFETVPYREGTNPPPPIIPPTVGCSGGGLPSINWNNPDLQRALQRVQSECGCLPTITCKRCGGSNPPCAVAKPGFFGSCPSITICTDNPTGCFGSGETIEQVLIHELIHAAHFCKYPITCPFSMCEEAICREYAAYSGAGQCVGTNDCCRRACSSVPGICNLLNDCESKCRRFIGNNQCRDGHYHWF